MKKYIFKPLSLAIALVLIMASCLDDLDQSPISFVGANGYFRNADDFSAAVAGAYSTLKTYPQRQFDFFEVRSDNIYVSHATPQPHTPVNDFATTLATGSLIATSWNDSYVGIARTNIVLEKITPALIGNEAIYNQYIGEMRFLRALFYLDLVRTYGAVPLVDKLLSPGESLTVGRSTPADIYDKLIIPDLQEAIGKLPPAYTGTNVGRATSWAAKALLARVYLTRSGPDYGVQGPGLNSNEYSNALVLLNDIVTNGPYSWVNSYASVFSYTNENNPDIVFDVQLVTGAGSEYPAVMYPQAFGQEVGIPYAGGVNTGSSKEVTPDLVNAYEATDSRRAVVMTDGWNPPSGPFRNESFISKFLNLTVAKSLLDRFSFPINFPVIRYTDVLMMRAEALLKTGGPQSEVDAIVNQVRSRAGISTLSNVTYAQLFEERRREFAGEGVRWHDLVRSGSVKTTMDAWLKVGDTGNAMPDVLDINHIIYPVPFAQMEVKRGLYNQNPGYN